MVYVIAGAILLLILGVTYRLGYNSGHKQGQIDEFNKHR